MLQPLSNGGKRASRSGYRTVRKSSEVDETLFGITKPGDTNKQRKDPSARVETFQSGGIVSPQAVESDATVLRSYDIARIKNESIILTSEDIQQMRRDREEAKERDRAVAIERKTRMLMMEEEAKKKVPPTETEKLKMDADNATLSKAQTMLDEESDDVKKMNQMMLYSKCVTIRDEQIKEKIRKSEYEEDENRNQDLLMEIDRIRALDQYAAREKKLLEDRRKGAEILKQQITDRAVDRQHKEEVRDLERQAMLKELERMKEDEARALQEKREQGKKLLAEVAVANATQIARKKEIQELEREEDERIRMYIRERELKERAAGAEAERIAREREMETQKLRAMQEKAADKQAELDELRAMRAQERYEREWREKERQAAERIAAANADLAEAREFQKASKMKQLADMARMEQEEFYRIIERQKEDSLREQAVLHEQAQARRKHKDEVINQIKHNESMTRRNKAEYLQEGERLRDQHRAQKAHLEKVKERKIAELTREGVPEKYRAELERFKISE